MSNATNQIPRGEIERALKGSGFPFQTAVRDEISKHEGYKIYASEYPWRNHKEEDSFLDLVATSSRFVLTIECKKTKNDRFIFLLPSGSEKIGDDTHFRCLQVLRYDPVPGTAEIWCNNWNVEPRSPRAEFCIVTTNSRERMLERDAAMLVSATDSFSRDKREWPRLGLTTPYFVVPVLVTNAELYAARYKPTEVSLQSGEFNKTPDQLARAPWIRFFKSFVAGHGRDLGERSIFVVNASSLATFLNLLDDMGPVPNSAPVKLV